MAYEVPRIPASAGSLIFDSAGRLLILKPTYKKRWTIPGGQIDEDGESPWAACRREALEECGLVVDSGRLVAVDFLAPRPGRPGGLRYLFDCGKFNARQLAEIRLQESEIDAYRFADLTEALSLLSGPLRRRVKRGAGRRCCVYLEEGRRVAAVS
jgi:8-oxo-dGTP diphosphatase